MNGFDEVYRRYFHDVFLYLRGLTGDVHIAEEITEETFFKAMKSIDEFKGNCDVRVWLCQIAKNSYFSYLRKRKRIIPIEEVEWIENDTDSMEKKLADREEAIHIHKILHSLEEPYKEVFSLRVFGELTFAQIACLFGKNENWACVTFHRAKRKIQDKWRSYNERN